MLIIQRNIWHDIPNRRSGKARLFALLSAWRAEGLGSNRHTGIVFIFFHTCPGGRWSRRSAVLAATANCSGARMSMEGK